MCLSLQQQWSALWSHFFVVKGKKTDSGELEQSNAQKALLAEEQERSSQMAKQKEKAEKLLSDARQEIASLEEKMKAMISDGKVDPSLAQKFADTDKLKKKIKELEGELEDAEDDLADTEKKLKNKTAELSELQSKNEKLVSAYEKSVREIGEIRQELNQKQEELGLKMQSLEFVQNILTAQVTETKDIAALNRSL